MPLDRAFCEGSTVGHDRFPNLKYAWESRRDVNGLDEAERIETVSWIEGLAKWQVAFDFTFGSGVWKGRRHGRREDVRDGLLVHRRYGRGLDADDALDLFRKFMHRVLPDTSWVAAIEPNRCHWLNPGCHGHAMLSRHDEIFRKAVQRSWVHENGWAKVNLIRGRAARAMYCTKHLVRRGLIFGYEVVGRGSFELAPRIESAL